MHHLCRLRAEDERSVSVVSAETARNLSRSSIFAGLGEAAAQRPVAEFVRILASGVPWARLANQLPFRPNSRVCSRFFHEPSLSMTSSGDISGERRSKILNLRFSGLQSINQRLPPCPVLA